MANYFGFPAKSWEENAEAIKYLLFVEPLIITEELFNDDDVCISFSSLIMVNGVDFLL